MTQQPERFAFFSPHGHRSVHREGVMVVVTFGSLPPQELTRFEYGTEQNELQRCAQQAIARNDPLLVDPHDDFGELELKL